MAAALSHGFLRQPVPGAVDGEPRWHTAPAPRAAGTGGQRGVSGSPLHPSLGPLPAPARAEHPVPLGARCRSVPGAAYPKRHPVVSLPPHSNGDSASPARGKDTRVPAALLGVMPADPRGSPGKGGAPGCCALGTDWLSRLGLGHP